MLLIRFIYVSGWKYIISEMDWMQFREKFFYKLYHFEIKPVTVIIGYWLKFYKLNYVTIKPVSVKVIIG